MPFCFVLAPFWGAFWDPFGPQIGPKSFLDASYLPKRRFLKSNGETNEKSMFLLSQWHPKTSPNRSKRLPRESFFRLRFRLRFGDDFGPILAPKMGPRGPLLATKIESKNDQKSIIKKSRLQNVLRWPKELPGEAPGGPRGSPGAPRGGPGRPQEAPGGPRSFPGRPNMDFQ